MVLYYILSKAAQMHPNEPAVICGDLYFTYAQFSDRVDRLAAGLAGLGVGHSDRIAVIHDNCHRFLEVYFAATRLGAILVPLNHRLIPKDFYFMINNSLAKTVIAKPEYIEWVNQNKVEVPLLENIVLTDPGERKCPANQMVLEYEALLDSTPDREHKMPDILDMETSQVYFTSGTTGRPKGVILTHRNNFVHARGCLEEIGLSEKDRWLHVSPMFHLADAWAVWAVTMAGGVHVIVPSFEPVTVFRAIDRHKVTLSNFIPTMLNILVNHPDAGNYDLSSMRLVMSGGAPIAPEVVRRIIDIFKCEYIQTYGLTETSPFLTMSILGEEMKELPFEERLRYMVTTGRPFYNVQLKVVREDGTEVAPDEEEAGEIVAKGETITPGYWNLPLETSTRIEDGWLHTRDLAVVNPEGYITIVDRMDDLILTGGENVYSIEVEKVLYSHPNVLEAAVVGIPDPVWGERVTAVVVPKEKPGPTEDELINFCRDRLAHFKTPKKVFFADALPKTGSAKVFKFKLREMYGGDDGAK